MEGKEDKIIILSEVPCNSLDKKMESGLQEDVRIEYRDRFQGCPKG